MKKFFKYLFITVALLILLGVLAFLGALGYEKYEEVTWSAPTEIEDVRIGMSRSDLLFKIRFATCAGDETPLTECSEIYKKVRDKRDDEDWVETKYTIYLEGDIVSKVRVWQDDLIGRLVPFDNVADLTDLKGEPDILAIDKDLTGRTYTYIDEGVSYRFYKDSLSYFTVGKLDLVDTVLIGPDWSSGDWKTIILNASEYSVRGRNLCPAPDSTDCPFNEDGSVKDGFKNVTPKDLL